MKKIYLLGLSIISATFIGCGGGSSSSTSSTKVLVEDGIIVGAKVIDSANHIATYDKDGYYIFNTKATLPIKIVTQNTIIDGNVSGEVKTFQDLNHNGVYDTGDVPYNVAMSINYSGSQTDIKANPVTALIPANWDQKSDVAGLSANTLNTALTTGITDSNDTTLKLTAAKITAAQEAFVKYGLKPDESYKVIDDISSDTNANIVEDYNTVISSVAQNLINDSTLFDDTQNLTDVSEAVSNVANSIQEISTNTELSTPETLVAAVQTLSSDAAEVATNTNPITTDDLATVDSNVFKTLVDSLELIPLRVIDQNDTNIANLDVLKVTNFHIEYIDDTHIKVVATPTSDFDEQYSFVINHTYTKDDTGAFVYKEDDSHIAKIVFDYEGGRYLVIEVNSTNIPYPLLTTDEIKNNSDLMDNKDLIDSVNEEQL